jgi:hypothetical protein
LISSVRNLLLMKIAGRRQLVARLCQNLRSGVALIRVKLEHALA